MKRIAEIKAKREHAFWKQRYVALHSIDSTKSHSLAIHSMAASKEKLRAHRTKKMEKSASVKLVEPVAAETSGAEKIREKIKVSTKSRSALIPGEGRSMGMDID